MHDLKMKMSPKGQPTGTTLGSRNPVWHPGFPGEDVPGGEAEQWLGWLLVAELQAKHKTLLLGAQGTPAWPCASAPSF